MSEPIQPPDGAQQRREQIRAYLAAQRGAYNDDAIKAGLRQAGYPDAEIEAVFAAERSSAGRPAFGSPWPALGLGMGLTIVNLIVFPFMLVLGLYLTNSLNVDALALVAPAVLLGLEIGLIWLVRKGRVWTTPLLLALLVPLSLHALFFGICTVSLIGV